MIREFRKKNGWTQKEAAEKLGVNQSQISRWERGVQPVPKWAYELVKCLDKRERPDGTEDRDG